MGNPSGAVKNTSYPANYLIARGQYALSYHRDRGIANWVAWQLNSTWITGSAVDNDQFKTDATLPTGWYRVKTGDYTNSGFSRGHLCASADRKNTQA
ncbi:MAG: DNA/RNA non-specific endonuclease, partial [Ignavibacteriales bacterium]|nr:DNA/RNA non-specific endonuclease [Ignavibacteriales bacterium]